MIDLILIFTTVLSHWDFSHEKFGLLSPGKASCDRVELPNLQCLLDVFTVSIIHQSKMHYAIFNVSTDINAIDCTGAVFTGTISESALKVGSERKITCRTRESNLRQRRAGLTLYQLSQIPHPHPTPISFIEGSRFH